MRGRFFFSEVIPIQRGSGEGVDINPHVTMSVDLADVEYTRDDAKTDVMALYTKSGKKFLIGAHEDVEALRAILDDEAAHNNAALLIGQENI